MVIVAEVHGVFATNAYIYADDATRAGFLIDPGAEADKLLQIINSRGLAIEKILLTHGHFDHIGAAAEIQRELKIPICMQKNGRAYVENPVWNLSRACGLDITLDDVTYLDDNSEIILAANPAFRLKIIPVAGHTTDGATYYSAKDSVAFVGDSIFLGSFGRTDFYGGDEQRLFAELKSKILTLPDDTVLLSGHSPPTTVGDEKTRPWFR